MFLQPKALEPGDTIGVIAPSGRLSNSDAFYKGLHILEGFGYRLRFPRKLWPGSDYLADTDENRALEFHKMWADEEVQALICMRGGYGVLRMLEFLELKEIKKTPKYLLGFSDISLLQNYLLDRIGLPAIHGPVVTSLATASRSSVRALQAMLTGDLQQMLCERDLELLHGEAGGTGTLVGGNLTSLSTVLGTPFDISWKDKFVFLEDVGEPIYRIDRMLTQLAYAGKFKDVAGILLGDFSVSGHESSMEKMRHREMVWSRLLEIVGKRNIPVLAGIRSGHIMDNHPLLLGSTVRVAPGERRLSVAPPSAE
ncbi:S66 peptidase family protein [Desulfotalea psychrophila]|nr:LD-carboxypeptidase [Desulfotalea psychrophila]